MKKLLAWLILVGLVVGLHIGLVWLPSIMNEPWWAALAVFYGAIGAGAAIIGIVALLNWAWKTLTE